MGFKGDNTFELDQEAIGTTSSGVSSGASEYSSRVALSSVLQEMREVTRAWAIQIHLTFYWKRQVTLINGGGKVTQNKHESFKVGTHRGCPSIWQCNVTGEELCISSTLTGFFKTTFPVSIPFKNTVKISQFETAALLYTLELISHNGSTKLFSPWRDCTCLALKKQN